MSGRSMGSKWMPLNAAIGSAALVLLAMGMFAIGSWGTGVGTAALAPADLTATAWCSVATSQAGSYVMIWDIFGTPTPTPTRAAAALPAAQPQPTQTGQPERPQSAGDPARGKAIFHGIGTCNACHLTGDDATLVGPSLRGIASRAGGRKPGQSAETYLRAVILNPDENVVPGTTPGIMPRTFGKLLTAQQLDDLVAYLMTLQ